MALDPSLARRLRLYGPRDRQQLPDSVLEEIVQEHTSGDVVDFDAVIAHAWTYVAAGIQYAARQVGNISVSQPLAPRMATYYQGQQSGGGGVRLHVGTLTRSDLYEPETLDGEHSS